jgi:hypothetical protein
MDSPDAATALDSPGDRDYFFPLGSARDDGKWSYFEADLAARLAGVPASNLVCQDALAKVHGVILYGAMDVDDLDDMDDIILSGGALGASYALIPGAAIGGYLGAQSGSE